MQLRGQNENANVMVVALPLSQRAAKVEAQLLRHSGGARAASHACAPTLEARAGFEPATYNQSKLFPRCISHANDVRQYEWWVTRTTTTTLTLA